VQPHIQQVETAPGPLITALINNMSYQKDLCRQLRWLLHYSFSYPQLALWARRISPALLA